MPRSIPAALVLALLAAPLAEPVARACSCMATTVWSDYNESDAAFVARVDHIEPGDGLDLLVHVEILRAWHGASPGAAVLHTASSSAACGYAFEEGRTYLVFAGADASGALYASLCSATQPVADVETAERLLAESGIAASPAPPGRPAQPAAAPPGTLRPWPTVRLSAADMVRANARTLTDLLWPVAGVFPLRSSRATTGIRLWGLTGRHTLVLLDGFRLNSAILGDRLDPQQGLMDLDGLSEVAVLPGLDTAAWGSDALGGAVSLTSRRPATGLDPAGRSSLLMRFDSADLAGDGAGRVVLGLGPVTVLGGVHAVFTGDLRPGSPLQDVDTSFQQLGGDVGLFASLGPGLLSARYLGASQSADAGNANALAARDFVRRDRHLVWIGYGGRDLAPWAATADVRAAFMEQSEETPVAVDASHTETVRRGALIGRVRTPLGEHLSLDWGLDLDLERLAVSGAAQPSGAQAPPRLDGSSHLTTGASTALTATPGSSTAVTVAARGAWVRAEVPATEAGPGTTLSTATGSATARLDQVLAPDLLQGHVAVATGVSQPNLADLTALDRTAEATFLPNPDLAAEQALGAEAGLWLTAHPFECRLTGHYLALFDRIGQHPTGQLDSDNLDPSGAPLPFVAVSNDGQARLYGLELELSMALGDLRAYLSTAWMAGDDLSAHTPLAGVPPLDGLFGLEAATATWGAGAYTRYALPADRTAPGEAATDGFAVFGLRGYYQWAAWGAAVLTIDNLADQGYRTHGSSVPEPGFHVVGTLRFQLDAR